MHWTDDLETALHLIRKCGERPFPCTDLANVFLAIDLYGVEATKRLVANQLSAQGDPFPCSTTEPTPPNNVKPDPEPEPGTDECTLPLF